ncbi:uncharacterized protein PAN0_013c4694 [Moesziomyces antarcticus]|uniref:Uncharacterized protein n=2 Tax=Pseudozyma antarctica TaxID=84753 RepID=A0A5C3FUS2_PSEA2|nr:uncharacterized protein PAN0_013c4694 [Moesziomyces antarcticus]GAK66472.1 hypothetical protein PAN0_013c4694 [Moesziomyces antarcticus]SPO47515.1 uncharacterized protein PSANT_05203 [Moesziomyces antarcticus]
MRMFLVLILGVLVAAVVGEDVARPHIEFPAGAAGGLELVQSEYNQFAPQHHGGDHPGGDKKHHPGGKKKHHHEEKEGKKKLAHWMHRWGWNPSRHQLDKLYSLVQPHKHHRKHRQQGSEGHHEGHHRQGEGEEKHHQQVVEKKHRHEEKVEKKKLLHWLHRFGWNPSPHQLDKLHSLGHSHRKQHHAQPEHHSEHSKDAQSGHHSGQRSGDRPHPQQHGSQESQTEPPAWKSLGPIPGSEVHLPAHLGILPPGLSRPRTFGNENPSPPLSSSSSVSAANAPLPAPGHVATSTATNRTLPAPPSIGQAVLTQTPSLQAVPTMGNATSGSLGPSSTQPPPPPSAGSGGMIAGIPVVDGADAKIPAPRVVNSTSAASAVHAEGWSIVAAAAILAIVA